MSMTKAIPLAFCLAMSACVIDSPKRERAAKKSQRTEVLMDWNGQTCGVSAQSTRVILTHSQWSALWQDIGSPAPTVDLSKNFAVAVFLGGRRTGGFTVGFQEPRRDPSGALVIGFKVGKPQGFAIQMLTNPYAVKLFAGTETEVRVEEAPE